MSYVDYAIGVAILSSCGAVFVGMKMLVDGDIDGAGPFVGGIMVLAIISALFFQNKKSS